MQVMDTPGLLPREDKKRNEMEMLTLASMEVLLACARYSRACPAAVPACLVLWRRGGVCLCVWGVVRARVICSATL